MIKAPDEFLSAALLLSPEARAEIADVLLKSLEGPEQAKIDSVWSVEAERRIDQIDNGEVALIPGDEVLRLEASRSWQ